MAIRCKTDTFGSKDEGNLFEAICTKTDCDIISLDMGKRFAFYLTKTPLKMALERGAVFEINYGQGMLENNI